MTQEALKLALDGITKVPTLTHGLMVKLVDVEAAIKEAFAQTQEPVAWKLMPRDATDAMLKAMDECSTEGYDERLYAGHAASVYMAAWDEAPTPLQRTWVGLEGEEIRNSWEEATKPDRSTMTMITSFARAIEAKLKEKNT